MCSDIRGPVHCMRGCAGARARRRVGSCGSTGALAASPLDGGGRGGGDRWRAPTGAAATQKKGRCARHAASSRRRAAANASKGARVAALVWRCGVAGGRAAGRGRGGCRTSEPSGGAKLPRCAEREAQCNGASGSDAASGGVAELSLGTHCSGDVFSRMVDWVWELGDLTQPPKGHTQSRDPPCLHHDKQAPHREA